MADLLQQLPDLPAVPNPRDPNQQRYDDTTYLWEQAVKAVHALLQKNTEIWNAGLPDVNLVVGNMPAIQTAPDHATAAAQSADKAADRAQFAALKAEEAAQSAQDAYNIANVGQATESVFGFARYATDAEFESGASGVAVQPNQVALRRIKAGMGLSGGGSLGADVTLRARYQWRADVTYDEPCLVLGLDGKVYRWVSASGPELSIIGAREPGKPGSEMYWLDYAASIISASTFAAGTRLAFQQSAAPTGWVKDTNAAFNDAAPRFTTGNVTTGGTEAFSAAFNAGRGTSVTTVGGSLSNTWVGGSTGGTSLDANTLPWHRHKYYGNGSGGKAGTRLCISAAGNSYSISPLTANSWDLEGTMDYSGASWGHGHSFDAGAHSHTFYGASHGHTVSFDIKYVDMIICYKAA